MISLGTVPIDLPRLLETRMLIQANSGGGKSHTLRRVLEQTAPLVQQLVIDPEGEFATLRERFDYIVCAPSGADAVATPKTAAALAQALWRSGSSAVVDIYELQKHERVLFVRRFLEALIAAPKSAWHQTIVALDEIQDYCPETGNAESSGAVVDVSARGRKRGLCLVGATQRIARLSKDCAAELLNKAIGRTGLDVDVRRAMAELGMSNYREALETLRTLDAGEFFTFGPALTRSVERTRVGPVVTTHPEIGKRALLAPPPASAKVLTALAKLEGIQREAAEEAKTVEALQAEVTALRRKLTIAEKAKPPAPQQVGHTDAQVQQLVAAERVKSQRELEKLTVPLAKIRDLARDALGIGFDAMTREVSIELRLKRAAPARTAPAAPIPDATTARHVRDGMSAAEQRVLDAIAWWRAAGVDAPSRHQVAFVAKYTVNGHFSNVCGTLRGRGLVDYPGGGALSITDAGATMANAPTEKPTRDELIERISSVLKGEPQRRLFAALVDAGEPLSRDELARRCNYTVNGHFSNLCGALNGIGVAEYPSKGMVGLSDVVRGVQ